MRAICRRKARSRATLLEKQKIQPGKKIDKPWGHELLWAHTEHYVAKILFVKAGESLSLQYHREKEETMFVQDGTCQFETVAQILELKRFIFLQDTSTASQLLPTVAFLKCPRRTLKMSSV